MVKVPVLGTTLFPFYSLFMKNKVVDSPNKVADSPNKVADYNYVVL